VGKSEGKREGLGIVRGEADNDFPTKIRVGAFKRMGKLLGSG